MLFDTRPSDGTHADAHARSLVGLEYLTSYHGMGVVHLSCRGGCSCAELSLNAHRTSTVRNETVFSR